MKLETRSLELMLAIAEHGTLTRAARHVHLTQSALSHHLLQLEARLGVALFHRLSRRMVPTPAGEHVVELARRIVPELIAAEEELQRQAGGRGAVIRVTTECYTSYHWLPRVISAFRRLHPGAEVRIVPEATPAPIEALLASQVDVAIVHSDATPAGVRTVPLFTDELVLVTAPSHPLAARDHVSAPDLRREHLILYSSPPTSVSVAREFLMVGGAMSGRISSVPLTEGIVEMVKAGLGVTILSRWAVQPHLEAGAVASVRLGHDGVFRHWSAAMLHEVPPVYLRQFVELIAPGPSVVQAGAASA